MCLGLLLSSYSCFVIRHTLVTIVLTMRICDWNPVLKMFQNEDLMYVNLPEECNTNKRNVLMIRFVKGEIRWETCYVFTIEY